MSLKSTVDAACPAPLRPYWERLVASSSGSRLARGVFWSLVGTVASRGLVLLATMVVARILGRVVYGELGMIQSTVGMFGVFAGFGLGLTATKHVAELRVSDPARVGRILGLSGLVAVGFGGVMSLALILGAPWLAENTINAPHLVGPLRIGAAILFMSALNGAQTGALSGFEAFKTIARVNVVVGLLSFPLLVAGAYLGGLRGAVWALAVNLALNWLLNHLALRKEAARFGVPMSLQDAGREWGVLWRFSLPAALGGVVLGPVEWACSAMLVNQPGGYGEMGIYNAAAQWFTVLLFIPSVIGSVVLPVLADQLSQNDAAQSRRTLQLSVKTNLFFVAPLALVVSLASPFVMRLYGSGFESGWPVLVVILVSSGLVAIQTPVAQFITASGRMWTGFVMNVAWASAFIGAAVLLIGQGALGLALAKGIAYVAHATWTFGFAFRMLNRSYERSR